MGCGKQHQLKKHPSLHYHKTYSTHEEASDCWHVQMAAKFHNIRLIDLVKALAGGINLISAIASLAAMV